MLKALRKALDLRLKQIQITLLFGVDLHK